MKPGTLAFRASLIKSICKGWISWFKYRGFGYYPQPEWVSMFTKAAF